jgi:hypothetical protein
LVPFGCFEIALLQDGSLSKNIDFATNIEIPTVNNLSMVLLLTRVDLFHIIFGVLDDDLMRLTVKLVNNRDLVPLSIFYPP